MSNAAIDHSGLWIGSYDPAWEITDAATGRSLGAWCGATSDAALDAWAEEEGHESWAAAVKTGRAPARVTVTQYDDGPR